jgi:class 3 adenylate cyclase
VQDLAVSRAIFATESVVENPQTSMLLEANNLRPLVKRMTLRGIAGEMMVYEIP